MEAVATRTTKERKQHRPSTQRTRNLRQAYMAGRWSICADRSVLVTDSYKTTEALPPVLRQARAFEKVLSEMPIWIQEGELLVGNFASRPKGVFLYPEYDQTWLEGELDTIATRKGDSWQLSDKDKERLKGCMEYWHGKNLAAFANALTPDEVKQAELNAFINIDMGKQCGVGHIVPGVDLVISEGLNALIEQAQNHLDGLDLTNPDDYAKFHFLQAVIIADKAVVKWAKRFAELAREKAAAEHDAARKLELEQTAEVCDRVPANPARTFREALQVVAFVNHSVHIEAAGPSNSVGRLDQYFLPFYEKDLTEGVMTRAQALELLECLWLKLAETNRAAPALLSAAHYGYPMWVQISIGGQTRDGSDATNELSYLFLDVSTNMQLAEPTVSARIHNRTPAKFLMKCGEAIRSHGGGHPALFNDEVIIPGQLANVEGMTIEDAYDYSIMGCSEVVCAGKGTEGLPYHAFSQGRALELMMAGKDPVTGAKLTSGVGDMLQWKTADDMKLAFSEQVRRFTRIMFMQMVPLFEAHTRYLPSPYLSSITRDCIKRGKSFYDGGAIYGNGVVNVCYVGIATLANSIATIKKLVFDDQVITMAQLKHALETNFEDATTSPTGAEIRQLCLRAPKYGNDNPYVDDLIRDYLNLMVRELGQYRTRAGGGYEAVIAPVAAHIPYGAICGATPDGRKSGEPLSDSASPAQGTDVLGPTASIKSVAGLEHIRIARGTIFNMKMHPAALETRAGISKWADLVRTYFDLGGWEIQFNVVSTDTLRDAQKHPEAYRDLVVRVVGYSAFFTELDKSVQDDIISRMEHSF
jgi:pyruvate formate-lyase/glycerol dehydratase family glycyl radical enzyme